MAEPLPITPFWFKQRQCKLEQQGGDQLLKVTGPNLADAFLRIQAGPPQWTATLRFAPDGPDVATAVAEFPSAHAAWNAAFELYRQKVIV